MKNEPIRSCCGPSCCDGAPAAPGDKALSTTACESPSGAAPDVLDTIRAGYGAIARAGSWSATKGSSSCCGGAVQGSSGGGCCGPVDLAPGDLARAIGYSAADLKTLPEGANMGLSCGNPAALAALKPGEVVLDLGSGGGFDCFIAGPRVGASGRVIGVDMTPDMLTKARRGLVEYHRLTGLRNVEFRLGEIEHLPVADSSVDVVISNCVLNLSPDKPQVWREIARALRPGGRVAISDLALRKPLPAALRADIEALVGCVAGAVLIDDVRAAARDAGLIDIELIPRHDYIDAMTSWQDPLYQRIIAALPQGEKVSDTITSLEVRARKR